MEPPNELDGLVDLPHGAESFRRGRLLRGAVTVMTGTILQKVIGLGFVAIFAHRLGRHDFDQYVYATAFGMFFETISDFGVDLVFARELNQRPVSERGKVIGTAIGAKFITFSFTLGLAFLASGLRPGARVIALVATSGLLCGLTGTLGLALQASNRNVVPEIFQFAGSFGGALGLGIAIYVHASVMGLVVTQTTIRFAVAFAAYPFLKRALGVHLRFDPVMARQLIRSALPVAVGSAAVVVFTRIDQLLIGAIGKTGDLSAYAVAVRVIDGVNFIPIAIGTLALPTFSHLESYDKERLRRLSATAIRYIGVIVLPLAVAATLCGGPALGFVFGHRFGALGSTLAVLAWAHFFACSFVLVRPILIANKRVGYMAWLAIAAAAVNIGLNLWWIPRYGPIGAAWASLLAYATPFAVAAMLPAVRDSFAAPLRGAIRPALAAGVLVGITHFVGRTTEIRVVALIVLTPVMLLATRAISVREVRQMGASFVKGH